MVVFRFPVLVRGVHAVIEGQKIAGLPAAVDQVNQANAADHAVNVARVLALGQLDKAAVALILHAVIYQQKSFGRVV